MMRALTDEALLEFKISDSILEAVDIAEHMTRSDLQGFVAAMARDIIAEVRS